VAARLFADEELARLREFPDISRDELFRYFTLTPADLAFIDPGRGRGPADRLGVAVALCSLPWLGFVPDKVASAPPVAVARLADQLKVDADDIRSYGKRAQTRTDHLKLVAQYLGWRPAAAMELKELDNSPRLFIVLPHSSPPAPSRGDRGRRGLPGRRRQQLHHRHHRAGRGRPAHQLNHPCLDLEWKNWGIAPAPGRARSERRRDGGLRWPRSGGRPAPTWPGAPARAGRRAARRTAPRRGRPGPRRPRPRRTPRASW